MAMEDDKKTCVCIQCELSCCINVSRLLYVSSNEIIINMEIKTGNVFKLNFDPWCCAWSGDGGVICNSYLHALLSI